MLELSKLILFSLEHLLHSFLFLLRAPENPCILLLELFNLPSVELDFFRLLIVLGDVLFELSSILVELSHDHGIISMGFNLGLIVDEGVRGCVVLTAVVTRPLLVVDRRVRVFILVGTNLASS